ncbi:MAG: hypothetical protein M3680_16605 [Myxococcota bacterium]|nr:hypothetical protein [Myxococcota bacterium]
MWRCLLPLIVAVGCKDAAPTVTRTSCEVPVAQTCEDYASQTPVFTKSRREECDEVKGTWRTAACPTASLAGSCTEVTKKWTRIRRYYQAAPPADPGPGSAAATSGAGAGTQSALERLRVECGAYGTWTAGS